jgi:ribosomal protein S18 acetylase RimI-like enzyme
MIDLKPIIASEYSNFYSYFIKDYSQELEQNYGYSHATAVEIAEKDLERCFPNGSSTKEHQLTCITRSQNAQFLGYLWHSIDIEKATTFIYDVYIIPEFRNCGYGTMTLAKLEQQMSKNGICEIKLRVAYTNGKARKLYERIGFKTTGYNMSKNIKKPKIT